MNFLRSDLVKPLGLNERIHWRTTGACPIGICFRVIAENSAPESWPLATDADWREGDSTRRALRVFSEHALVLEQRILRAGGGRRARFGTGVQQWL
jgi:hypothetical protein